MTDKPKDWASIQEESDNGVDEVSSVGDALEPAAALDYPSHVEMQAQISDLETACEKAKDEAARAIAELDNVRKRTQRDVENAYKFGLEKFVRELLQVADSLEHAAIACDSGKGDISVLKEGIDLTTQLMQATLGKFNVALINPENEAFDPNRHEAISMQEAPGVAANTVIAVVQKGYSLNDRVIRPARVIIAKSSS